MCRGSTAEKTAETFLLGEKTVLDQKGYAGFKSGCKIATVNDKMQSGDGSAG